MAVGLQVANIHWLVGAGSFFNAFFSTIAARLEPAGWATRFPAVMGDLFSGELTPERAVDARKELDTIRAELAAHPPADVVLGLAQPPSASTRLDSVSR